MKKLSQWFIDNPIAAKILMLMIIVAGLKSYPIIAKQFFPVAEVDFVRVTVVYPGAGPSEIESQIVRRIEEAISSLDRIEEVNATIREGYCTVNIEVTKGADSQALLNDVRSAVDAISTFPDDAEPPEIVVMPHQNTMMTVLLAGDLTEHELKELGESIRDELAALPSVMLAELQGGRPYEMNIEVDTSALKQYQLSIDDIANAVRSYSFSQPSGSISDSGGDIQLQARLQAESPEDFRQIPVLRSETGGVVRIGDIATVNSDFEDVDIYGRHQGVRSLFIAIINRDKPQILQTSKAVKNYLEARRLTLPEGVTLTVWWDMSHNYKGRLDTLIKNGSSGLLLVFFVLMLFLRPALAAWVCMGIAVAFLGALWAMSLTTVTLNVMSMFAYIMILGIIVDDAIIVGESVHSHQESTGDRHRGAIAGVNAVLAPVVFAVVSTVIFFIPFFDLHDQPNTAHIAIPVILALIFSLVEALLLLPSHLASKPAVARLDHSASEYAIKNRSTLFEVVGKAIERLATIRASIAASIPYVVVHRYRPILLRAIASPHYTLLVFFFLFLLSIAFVRGNWLGFSFFPRVSADWVIARATLAESSPIDEAHRVMNRLEDTGQLLADRLNSELNYPMVGGVYAEIEHNIVTVQLRLSRENDRPMSGQAIAGQWREKMGDIEGLKDLTVSFTLFEIPKPVALDVRSDVVEELNAAAQDMVNYLTQQAGIFDVRSSQEDPVMEINYQLKQEVEPLAVTSASIARQIRQAFYGEEVQRIPAKREDIKVFVRYPEGDRARQQTLLNMDVQIPAADYVPLHTLVDFEHRDALKKVTRIDEKRVAKVSADIEPGYDVKTVTDRALDYADTELAGRYPSVDFSLKGEQQESEEFYQRMQLYFMLSLMAIYGLMAVMFRSYWMPLVVLSAIPFGYVGGLFGHIILGQDLSMMSMLGMLACAGVVVNDNMVLINRINHLREEGQTYRHAVVNGAMQRFRAIVLTSVTTFVGLAPILFESSVQAQFLIPMVTSLAFGVLFATVVTMFFVPCLYLFSIRCGQFFRRLQKMIVPNSHL